MPAADRPLNWSGVSTGHINIKMPAAVGSHGTRDMTTAMILVGMAMVIPAEAGGAIFSGNINAECTSSMMILMVTI